MNTYDRLKENLAILFPDHQLASNGREFRINCPMCEREGYPDKGYHLYISIFESDKPPLYNCFRNSNHRGVLTKSFIEQYSAYPQYVDTDLLDLIRNQANRAAKLNRYRFNKNYGFKLINPIAKNDEKSMIKLGYINSRLGTNLTLEDMVSLKIVLNLGEFIYNNRLRLTRSDNSVFALDEYFVGFLSNNNAFIRLRRIPDKLPNEFSYMDKRYMNYKTIDDPDANSGYYIIPSICDKLKPIRINIAEGQFDILSVFLNLCNRNTVNNIYAAIGSNSYLATMKYFLEEYGLIDIEFHLYIDNDIDNNVLPRIKQVFCDDLFYTVFIHVNMKGGEKDFGVPLDRIQESIYKL